MSGEYTVLLIGTGGNILYLHRGFCQYCWVWIQVYRSRWILLRNWVQLCSHTDSQHMICLFLYLKCKIPPSQMKGTKQMKHKWTLKWPIRKHLQMAIREQKVLRRPPSINLLSIRDLSTGVSANALNSICTNICNVRSLRQFSDYTQHC